MGRKAARNMYSRNTNKIGIRCICWFYSQGITPRLSAPTSLADLHEFLICTLFSVWHPLTSCAPLHQPCTSDGIYLCLFYLCLLFFSAVLGRTKRAGCILYFHGLLIQNTEPLLCQIQQDII